MKELKWEGNCHIVIDSDKQGRLIDMHTHGLENEIGTELQYVLNVGKQYYGERQTLLGQVATEILNGKIDKDSNNPFELEDWEVGTKFKLFKTKDSSNKDIYRIIECDMNGKFPEDEGCEEGFNLQYEDPYRK